MKRKIISLVIVSILLVSTAACGNKNSNTQTAGQGSNQTAAYKDTIKIGLDVDPDTMDPRLQTNVSGQRVSELVFSGLIELNGKLEPTPCLAEKWEQKDAQTLIFHLRKDVKWHDGTPFTAADVKYTFESILDPKLASPARSRYSPIKEILTPDDYTVQFNLSQPNAPLLTYMDYKIVPQSSKNNPKFFDNPIGTGAYKFVSWSKNNKISLTANDSYFGGAPATKNIELYTIPDNTTRVAALESGDVDFIHSPLSPQDVTRMKQNNKFTVYQTNGLGITFVNFNSQAEILKDKNVRIALSYMIDKGTISKDIYQGMDTPANGPILPASWAYSPDLKDYPFDPAKGLQILNDDGWKDTDGDKILDKNGKKLTVKLSTHTEDPNRMQALEFIQNTLKSQGIDTQVRTVEWPTFSADMTAGNYEIAIVGLLNINDPDRGLYIQFHTGGGQNYGKYSYPALDALLEKGRSTTNQDERKKTYQDAAKMINDEVLWKSLVFQGYIAMYTNNLEGFTPIANGQICSMKNAKVKK